MKSQTLSLHPDRLLGATPQSVDVARRLFAQVESLPIISPHGHTDPSWFAKNENFSNATELLLTPDHYLLRLLYSQGIDLTKIGIQELGSNQTADPEQAWQLFAENYHLFLGTPSRFWLDHVFVTLFGFEEVLSSANAANYFEKISSALATDEFKPRALLNRFNVETIATTEAALDSLSHHKVIMKDGLGKQVVTTFRPDDVTDPDRPDFITNLEKLAELTGEDTQTWNGYLAALRNRRQHFIEHGATATDHGHASAATADLSAKKCQELLSSCVQAGVTAENAELFRAQVLTEMAGMSLQDGLVMQLHPGSYRNHNPSLLSRFGRDKGADIPVAMEYVNALKPLLDKYGNNPELTLILFTLDETTYSRELAPLAGHYPALKLGPSWWFHDSPEGMLRFRQQVTETAGFYNTVGFNDDTRALLSIPARHDLARRIDCQFLANWVLQHRLSEQQAGDIAIDLAYELPKAAYRL